MALISARRLQGLSVIFGLLVSGYLSYLKIVDAPSVCLKGGPFKLRLVLNSKYSELGGIPIAWLGFAIYLFLACILLMEDRHEVFRQYGRIAAFGVGLFAWLFSMWLVYVQFVLLAALCPGVYHTRSISHYFSGLSACGYTANCRSRRPTP